MPTFMMMLLVILDARMSISMFSSVTSVRRLQSVTTPVSSNLKTIRRKTVFSMQEEGEHETEQIMGGQHTQEQGDCLDRHISSSSSFDCCHRRYTSISKSSRMPLHDRTRRESDLPTHQKNLQINPENSIFCCELECVEHRALEKRLCLHALRIFHNKLESILKHMAGGNLHA